MPFSEGLALPGVYAVPARVVNFALSFLCLHVRPLGLDRRCRGSYDEE